MLFTFSYPAFQLVSARVFMYSQSFSPVQLFTTPWTSAHQAPPSMEFPRQEDWTGEPSPSKVAGDFLYPETKSTSPALAGGFFTTKAPGKPSRYTQERNSEFSFLKPQSYALSFKFLNFSSNFLGSQLPHLSPFLALLIPPSS